MGFKSNKMMIMPQKTVMVMPMPMATEINTLMVKNMVTGMATVTGTAMMTNLS